MKAASITARIAGAIFGVLFATAAAYAQTDVVVLAPSSDSEEPTSMPDACSARDVNCVVNTGMPHRRVFGPLVREATETATSVPGSPVGATTADGGAPFPSSAGSSPGLRGVRRFVTTHECCSSASVFACHTRPSTLTAADSGHRAPESAVHLTTR